MARTTIGQRLAEIRTAAFHDRLEGASYAAGGAVALILVGVGAVGPWAGGTAATCGGVLALLAAIRASRRAETVATEADQLILGDARDVAPDDCARRVDKLRSRRFRRRLANAVEYAALPPRATQPAARRRVRLDRDAQEAARLVAARLREDRADVDPRGVIAVLRLVTEIGGPLIGGDPRRARGGLVHALQLLDGER